MPEGDTLFRTAAGLRPYLVGRQVVEARTCGPIARTPAVGRLVGATVESVESVGKHLLIRFDNGLELRTHLGMHGSWHRYAPAERWRRPPSRARVVLEVPGAVAVCFDAPTVELTETRAEAVHPVLAHLGPDLLDPGWDESCVSEAVGRLRAPDRADLTIAEALLDQRALAGIGNIYKNETLFAAGVNPFTNVGDLDDATLRRLVETSHRLISEGTDRTKPLPARSVYDRAGRPCRRCGTLLAGRRHGAHSRRTIWCPRCQPPTTPE